MSLETIGDIEVASDQACVVYDATNGRIQHVHRVVTLKGGTEPNRSEIEARAMEFAATHQGIGKIRVKALLVSHEQLTAGATHKVDPKKGTLISTPIKFKGTRSSRAARPKAK
jgi:hypothetical protein